MSRTTKDNKFTKKQLVTDPIHRKAGAMKDRKKDSCPSICPDCEGWPMEDEEGNVWECPTCRGEMVVYE